MRREGRITDSQRRALAELWPRYGVEAAGLLDLDALFGRKAQRHIEIGFGMGEALLAMAETHPEHDYLGIEVFRPGVGSLLARLAERDLHNARVCCADAVEVLQHCIPDASLSAVYIFFPDPWPKKRHHKRRLIQPAFVAMLAEKLETGGRLFLATDWEDYARQMLRVLSESRAFINLAGHESFAERPLLRPPTKFEKRGQALGHGVWDLAFSHSECSAEAQISITRT